jgi:ribosomal protein S4
MGTNVNLKHLEARLKQTKTLEDHAVLNKETLIEMLERRFDTIDYASARSDVRPFIRDQSALELWSSGFFKSITRQIGTNPED